MCALNFTLQMYPDYLIVWVHLMSHILLTKEKQHSFPLGSLFLFALTVAALAAQVALL